MENFQTISATIRFYQTARFARVEIQITELFMSSRIIIIIIIIIITFLKGYVCFLFLDPQDEVCPSISSSVILCSIVLLVYIVVLVLVDCLCPSSVHVVATFGSLFVSILCTCCSHFFWYCFISFTVFCAPVFCLIH